MRFIKTINIALLLAGLSVSCVKNGDLPQGEGYLSLSVTRDTEVEIVPVTRTADQSGPVSLKICDSEGKTVSAWDDISQMEGPVSLLTGSYSAVASFGVECGNAVFDSPFYTGSSDFIIIPGVMTTVDLVCRLSSVMVTAEFSQEIKDDFTYSLTVTNGLGELVFNETTSGREGYFSPSETLTWTLEIINSKNERFLLTDSYEDVKPSTHYALSFSVEQQEDAGPVGAADFRIVVDDSFGEPKVHDVVLVIDKSAPSFSGPDRLVRYLDDECEAESIGVASTLSYSSVMIRHADVALSAAGLPVESELLAMTDFSVLTDSGIGIIIRDEDGNQQAAIDDRTVEVLLDMASLADNLPIGTYQLDVVAVNISGKEIVKTVNIIVKSSIGTITTEPWAEFIYVKGNWLSGSRPEDFRFQYRSTGASEWNDIPSDLIYFDESAKICRAFICSLEQSSSYELRVQTSKENSTIAYASTEEAPQLYNMSFDEWSKDGDTPYPYASGAAQKIWDTANGGTALMGVFPTTEEKTDVVRGSAARMESTYASMLGIGKFAAGNIYTGTFNAVSLSPMGATLYWGVPFYGRPLGLKGHYKYAPKPIDYVGSGYEHMKGQSDICQIQLALMDWTEPFLINTATNKFVDFSHANTSMLAHRDLTSGSTDGNWVSFNIPSSYRDLSRRPSYIILSACASRYGDYFTGGKGSVMWVDEFEFIYDPMELTETDRQSFFSLFK